MVAKKTPPGPSHYTLTLVQPFPVPGTDHVVPAGVVTLSAAIVAAIPAEMILGAKVPAEV